MSKDLILIILYIAVIIYLLAAKKISFLKHLIIAALVAIIWMSIAGSEYSYNTPMTIIFGINLYSFFGWALGLILVYIIYGHILHFINVKTWWSKLILFTCIYIPLLLAAETVAYHVFNVVNVATAMFSGFPICNCLHAPVWMKLAYLSMGSIYFILCLLLGLEKNKIQTTDEKQNVS